MTTVPQNTSCFPFQLLREVLLVEGSFLVDWQGLPLGFFPSIAHALPTALCTAPGLRRGPLGRQGLELSHYRQQASPWVCPLPPPPYPFFLILKQTRHTHTHGFTNGSKPATHRLASDWSDDFI